MDEHRQTAHLLKALSHPVRLQILEVLARDGEACVCHLEAHLGLRQAYISQQLARLREAGIVADHRQGLNVFYALVDPATGRLLAAARQAGRRTNTRARMTGERGGGRSHSVQKPCRCPRCGAAAEAVTA